jgi:hypothetical protein
MEKIKYIIVFIFVMSISVFATITKDPTFKTSQQVDNAVNYQTVSGTETINVLTVYNLNSTPLLIDSGTFTAGDTATHDLLRAQNDTMILINANLDKIKNNTEPDTLNNISSEIIGIGDTIQLIFDIHNDSFGLINSNLTQIKNNTNADTINNIKIVIDTIADTIQHEYLYITVYNETFTYQNNSDASDSILVNRELTPVKVLKTTTLNAIFDWYGLTDGVLDARKNKIKSITY